MSGLFDILYPFTYFVPVDKVTVSEWTHQINLRKRNICHKTTKR